MKDLLHRFLFLLVLAHHAADAFVVVAGTPKNRVSGGMQGQVFFNQQQQQQQQQQYHRAASTSSTSLSNNSKNRSSIDGTGPRGIIIQSIVLVICAWFFTIPVELRRVHFCAVERCVQNRSACYDCVTVSEWKQDITDYYANGGGIEWDFSISQESKDLFKK